MKALVLAALLLSCSGCFAPGWSPVNEDLYEVPVMWGYAWCYDCGVLLQGPWLAFLAFLLASGDVRWEDGKEVVKTVAAPFALVVSIVAGTLSLPATTALHAAGAVSRPSQAEDRTPPPAPLEPRSSD